jgi:gliding motility-associated-like protein
MLNDFKMHCKDTKILLVSRQNNTFCSRNKVDSIRRSVNFVGNYRTVTKVCMRKLYLGLLLFLLASAMRAQCPQFYDGTGALSSNPYWISCSGSSFTLNVASPTVLTTYSIDWGDGSAISSGGPQPANTPVVHNYAATIDTFNVTITTNTGTVCVTSGVVVMEKPVNASIQIPVGGVTTACAPATLQFTNSSTDVSPTTTFVWDFGDGSPTVPFDYTNGGQTISHTYLQGTVNCQTAVTLTAQNYCSFGSPTLASFNPIQIYDIDDAAVTPDAALKCFPDNSFTFTNTTARNCLAQGNMAQRYEYWNFGDHWGLGYDSILNWAPWPPTFPHTLTYPGVGSYTVMLVDSSFCGLDTAFVTVSIVSPPTAGVIAPVDSGCVGVSFTFNNTSSPGYSYSWNFGDTPGYTTFPFGPVTHTYAVAGTYTVSVVAFVPGAPGSCRDTAFVPVTVFPSPVSAFNASALVGCDSLTVTFTDASVAAVGWSWTFGNGNTSTLQNPPAQAYTVGSYTVSLQVVSSNGCPNTSQQLLNVYRSPVAAFTTGPACTGSPVNFTDASVSSAGDPLTGWSWNFGDGSPLSTLQNPSHTYAAAGTYTITLNVNTANCSGSMTGTITVNPVPSAGFTLAPVNGCGPLNVAFNNTSTGAATYSWSFGNGGTSTATNPSEIYTNPGSTDTTYYVNLVAITALGCKDSLSDSVIVFGKPLASFTSNAVAACAPLDVTFTNTSAAAVSYLWDFGDGSATSTTTSPTHFFQDTTLFIQNYTTTLIATNAGGCTDTATMVIQAFPEPIFGFQMVPDTGCTALTVSFPSVLGAVLYQWDFGDGGSATGANPVHTFVNASAVPATYTIQLIATNAFTCVDTTYGNVLIYPQPSAGFSSSVTQGCPNLSVNFTNTSTGAVSYLWNFDDGSPIDAAPSPSHVFVNTSTSVSDTFNVQLIATSGFGCSDTVIHTIIVYPSVASNFTANTPICSPSAATFNNLSAGGANYNWNFGDGNSSNLFSPTNSYINPGPAPLVFNITLTVTSSFGCADTMTQPYTVYPTPVASFTATPLVQTYPATTVTFTNTTGSAASYTNTWDFGDSNGSSLISPGAYSYGTWGTYNATLIVSNGFCSDTAMQTVTIIPPVPVAAFTGSFEGCRPLTITPVNNSQFATSYLWDFGDGIGTSTATNPTYTYYNPGNYTITLTATGPGGTNSVLGVDSAIVHDIPLAAFTASPLVVSALTDAVNCLNLSSGASSYVWNFGDGSSDNAVNPSHIYSTEGAYQISLIAISSFGCRDTFNLPGMITVESTTEITVPNAFTPNAGGGNGGSFAEDDLSNDVFHPNVAGVKKYQLSIYNRWGELIFESLDTKIGWDGYYRGELCQQDIYVWKIKATSNTGEVIVKTGDVTLLR